MTLPPRDSAVMPEDIAAVGAAVLAATSPYRIIGEQLADLFADVDFASLYVNHGRPAIAPALLAVVTIFQFLEDVPDRQAAEQARERLDWKDARHLPVADAGVDFSSLCSFRRRLLAHAVERQGFETVLARIQQLGLLKKGGKQRTDALAVLGAVARLGRLELVHETVRLALVALAEAAPLWTQRPAPASLREAYVRRRREYRLAEAERPAALVAVGQDGAWLLAQLATAPAGLAKQAAVQTLQTVWAQQDEDGADGLRLRAQPVPADERIVTPHDAGVRLGEKRGEVWLGEKGHITETAEPDQPTFIVQVLTANASSADSAALPAIRTAERGQGLLPGEQYVDAGYVTGAQLAASAAEGIALLGPALPDTSANGFKLDAFAIDEEARQARCPAGQTSVKWRAKTEPDGSQAVQIQIAAATGAACPMRAQCTTGTSGRRPRRSGFGTSCGHGRRLRERCRSWCGRMDCGGIAIGGSGSGRRRTSGRRRRAT